jgi:hypothetical protein
MSITAEPAHIVFRAPEAYNQTGLSEVAANYAMGRALSAQADRLALEYGDRTVEDAYRIFDQRGQVFVVNAITTSLERLREFQAASPFKNDYPDVRAQRERALDEVIAEAEAAERLQAPSVSELAATIVTTALLLEARSGSIEAADVLVSGHTARVWEEATGIQEIPEAILPPGAVTIAT